MGNTSLGSGTLWRMPALARRLTIDATMLWEKKFQNRIPARQ